MTKIHASKHELKIFLGREPQNNRPQNFVPLIKPDLLEILQQDPNPLTPTTSITPQRLSRFGIEVDEALRVGSFGFLGESDAGEEDEGPVLDGISFGP